MNMKFKLIIFIFMLLMLSCSQNSEEKAEMIVGDQIEEQMIIVYKEGVDALEKGNVIYAVKKFNESELLYPQSEWAPKASLMAAYAYWSQKFYRNSIEELQRFLKIYPKNKSVDYAIYLMAMNYYDSIVDEKKDLRPLLKSKEYFEILIEKYPETDYALDARYKLDLIQDMLAAKEMYIARHYIKKQKWIAALNRLKTIIDEYNTTVYIEEALHRIVEVYYILGLENEATKYAIVLGYNYKSGEWYKQSYKILNKEYLLENEKSQKRKNKLLERIKSIL
jgi:outer membrane protein assembly factor BamD